MSKHWPKRSVILEGLAEFATSIEKDEYFISMDVENGYCCLGLHPSMREWFIFKYRNSYYQCIELPFGWGRLPFWFCGLMAPFVRELRNWRFRVLSYVDNFLIAPSPFSIAATAGDCERASKRINYLLRALGLRRQKAKGCWGSGTRQPWSIQSA